MSIGHVQVSAHEPTSPPLPSPVHWQVSSTISHLSSGGNRSKAPLPEKNRSCCPSGEVEKNIKNSTTTGLLLSYNLQIALLVPSCTFIESYTCFQLQVVGVSTWNYAFPFIAVGVQASCTTTHELRLAVPMRKVYFVSIFKKQLRKLQIYTPQKQT